MQGGHTGTDKKLRVFIADDTDLVRQRLSARLSQIAGVEVAGQAQDVPEAVLLYDSLKPDVAIIDIQMPGGSGLDVLRHIKGSTPEVVVMMLTNFPYPHYLEASMKAGADHFFDKSADLTVLVEIITRLT